MRHSVIVFPIQPSNSSLKDCMKALKTSDAVRPLKTGTERREVQRNSLMKMVWIWIQMRIQST